MSSFKLRTQLRTLSMVISACSITSVLAQQNTITVTAQTSRENQVISASKTPTILKNIPRNISVLSANDIEGRPGATGIQSLLAELPGIDYSRSGGLGGQLVIRGFNTNDERSIVTIDGDRYRGRNTLQFNMFDPSSIERIEVIRGPASSLYGSDAMTGVINIITRRSHHDPFGSFKLKPKIRSLSYNSVNNMIKNRMELEGGGHGFDVMIGGVYSNAQDYKTPKGKAINSGFHYKGMDFNVGYNFSAQRRLEFSGRYQHVSSGRAGGVAGAPGYPFVLMNEAPIIEKYFRTLYRSTEPALAADSLEASVYIRDWKTDLNRTIFDGKGKVVNAIRNHVYNPTIYGGHITASKKFSNNTITYGGDFYYDDRRASFRSTNGSPFAKNARDATMLDAGLFINSNWQVSEQWILDGTLRGDFIRYQISEPQYKESAVLTKAFTGNTNQSHFALTGSVGAIYKFTADLQTFFNFSRGFRAPTAGSLVSSQDNGISVTLPAPDLKPETNISVETGIRYFATRHHLSLSIYQSNYTDLIAIEPVSPTVRKRLNINKAVARGVELEGKAYWTEKLSSKYSMTYSQAKDQNTGVSLGFIAPLKGSVSLKYDAYHWYLEAVMTAWAKKSFINPKKERTTAGYALVDLYAGMPLDNLAGSGYADWKLTVGIENLFNKAARNPTINEDINPRFSRELIGNPLYNPGRAFVIQLSGTY